MAILRIKQIAISILLLLLGFMQAVSAAPVEYTQSGIQIVGAGCTTAFYIDPLCKPCGVGMRSSGKYPVTQTPPAFGAPDDYAMGDMPDADPTDPNVCTTAQWEAKWGWTTPVSASDNKAMVNFLQGDLGFPNTSRIFYISMTGNDSTAVMNDPSHPYATMAAIEYGANGNPGVTDNQGGAIVIEGGDWGAPGDPSINLTPCQGGRCWELSGSPGHPLLITSFPGEVVQIQSNNNVIDDTGTYSPGKSACCMTINGLEFLDTQYGRGLGAIIVANFADFTVQNSEFAGWDKIMFNSNTVDALVKDNVFHDMMSHAIYFGFNVGITHPPGDFNFAVDHANLLAGSSQGASYHGQIIGNVIYGSGYSGYEPIHVNTYIDYPVVEGNIISYNGGTGIGLYTGVYHAFIADNLLFDNGRDCITLFLYDPEHDPTSAATLRWNTIENNTCYVGNPTDSIRGTGPGGGITQKDGTTTGGHYIKDTTIENNIIVTYDNGGSTGQLPLKFQTNSYPETDVITGNLFWSTGPSTGRVAVIDSDASPSGGAGTYTLAQLQAFSSSFSGNQYANPEFENVSPSFTLTPGAYNFAVAASSPAANIGANLSDLLTPPTPPPSPSGPVSLPRPPSSLRVK